MLTELLVHGARGVRCFSGEPDDLAGLVAGACSLPASRGAGCNLAYGIEQRFGASGDAGGRAGDELTKSWFFRCAAHGAARVVFFLLLTGASGLSLAGLSARGLSMALIRSAAGPTPAAGSCDQAALPALGGLASGLLDLLHSGLEVERLSHGAGLGLFERGQDTLSLFCRADSFLDLLLERLHVVGRAVPGYLPGLDVEDGVARPEVLVARHAHAAHVDDVPVTLFHDKIVRRQRVIGAVFVQKVYSGYVGVAHEDDRPIGHLPGLSGVIFLQYIVERLGLMECAVYEYRVEITRLDFHLEREFREHLGRLLVELSGRPLDHALGVGVEARRVIDARNHRIVVAEDDVVYVGVDGCEGLGRTGSVADDVPQTDDLVYVQGMCIGPDRVPCLQVSVDVRNESVSHILQS